MRWRSRMRAMLNCNSYAHLKLIFLFISLQQSGFTTPLSHSVATFFIRCINQVRYSQHAGPIASSYGSRALRPHPTLVTYTHHFHSSKPHQLTYPTVPSNQSSEPLWKIKKKTISTTTNERSFRIKKFRWKLWMSQKKWHRFKQTGEAH